MHIAIVGSRNYASKNKVRKMVRYLFHHYPDGVIVSGGAKGVDTWAEQEAQAIGMKTLIFPADWQQYGKSAGMIRNQEIINHSDVVIAFWDGASRGTKNTIDRAMKAKRQVWVYDSTGEMTYSHEREG